MRNGGPRVALVHGAAPVRLDGVSDYVAHLSEALYAAGAEPVVVPVRPAGLGGPAGWLSTVDDAATRIAALRPDLVHVQFAASAYRFSRVPGLLLPYLLRRRMSRRVPLVTTLHEYSDPPPGSRGAGWLWVELERRGLADRDTGRLVPASQALVVTNDAHARAVRLRTRRAAVRIPLAPNVPAAPAEPDVRARVRADLGLPANAPLLVFFGFVHPVKGVRYLIEALPALRARHPGLHLAVVGGFESLALPGPQALVFRVELASLAGRLELSRAVTFTGYQAPADASALLAAADVAVLPFTAGVTGKSGALLTVLAHRLPTVVTVPDDDEPELVDGQNVVCAAGRRNARALVEAVDRVLADPALAARIACGGSELAAARTWPRIAAAHRDLYAALLGKAGDAHGAGPTSGAGDAHGAGPTSRAGVVEAGDGRTLPDSLHA
jgi:glycosyltransferase involved in cell wall biosynthesis